MNIYVDKQKKSIQYIIRTNNKLDIEQKYNYT